MSKERFVLLIRLQASLIGFRNQNLVKSGNINLLTCANENIHKHE